MTLATAAPRTAAAPVPDVPRSADRWPSVVRHLILAVGVYVPLLLTARGRVVADTKQYLYLDPGRLLDRAPSMWDPNIGLGTVTHQNIGYLFPMGPWFWVFQTGRRARLGGPAPLAGHDHVRGRRRRAVPDAQPRLAHDRRRRANHGPGG